MLLGSSLCCWEAACAVGKQLMLLGSSLCCWEAAYAVGKQLMLLGSMEKIDDDVDVVCRECVETTSNFILVPNSNWRILMGV